MRFCLYAQLSSMDLRLFISFWLLKNNIISLFLSILTEKKIKIKWGGYDTILIATNEKYDIMAKYCYFFLHLFFLGVLSFLFLKNCEEGFYSVCLFKIICHMYEKNWRPKENLSTYLGVFASLMQSVLVSCRHVNTVF